MAACRLAVATALGLVCFSWTAGAAQDEPRQPSNAFCPVMTEEKVNPEFTTIFDGQVIGFCCEKCLGKFLSNPSRYAARVSELEGSKPKPIEADELHHKNGETQPASVPDGEQSAKHEHDTATTDHRGGADAHDHDQHEHEAPAAAKPDHDHEHGHTRGEGFFAGLINWLGKLHPPTVNFPIAMLLGAALAELLLIATGRLFFANAGRFCLWVGCVGAVAAAVLGWFFGGFHSVDDSWILTTHRWLGTTTAALSVLLLVVGERKFRGADASRTSYRTMLFIAAGLVGITGFFGGSLVYGLTHYAWS